MSEQLKEILTADDLRRQQFHNRLDALRMRNKDLSDHQRRDRLAKDEEKKKPVRERRVVNMLGKDPARAIEITVLLILMRRIKGLALEYVPEFKCRCCGHKKFGKVRPIHALPKDDLGMGIAGRITDEIVRELELDEFLK